MLSLYGLSKHVTTPTTVQVKDKKTHPKYFRMGLVLLMIAYDIAISRLIATLASSRFGSLTVKIPSL